MLPGLILNIANRQHGGPFPADLARRGMLLGTLGFFSFSIWYFTRGVNTSFQCCDQVLPLSQQLTITFGGAGAVLTAQTRLQRKVSPFPF